MQDGSFTKSKGIYLSTDSFIPTDTVRLAKHLTDKFGFKCTTPKAPGALGLKGHLRIYISAQNLELIRELVSKYFIPTLLYKIGL